MTRWYSRLSKSLIILKYAYFTMANVTIYSTPWCGWCRRTKEYFKQHNVVYTEKDVAADAAAREEMVAKSQQLGVPVIDIDGEIVVGFDQPKLARLLGL